MRQTRYAGGRVGRDDPVATSTTGGELARRAHRAPDAEGTAVAADDDSCDRRRTASAPTAVGTTTSDTWTKSWQLSYLSSLFLSLSLSDSLPHTLSLMEGKITSDILMLTLRENVGAL